MPIGRSFYGWGMAALVCALGSTASAEPGCFPELDDEVVVFFEQGELSHPVIVGSLWNGADVPPETDGEVAVLAPRHVASALLAGEKVLPGDYSDRMVGSVVRTLVERTAEEVAKTHAALEQLYEAGFMASAQGEWGDVSRLLAELVGGVFEAEVDASIQQMEAYAKLLAEAAASLGDDSESAKDETSFDRDLRLALAAELIDLDLSLRDPDCE